METYKEFKEKLDACLNCGLFKNGVVHDESSDGTQTYCVLESGSKKFFSRHKSTSHGYKIITDFFKENNIPVVENYPLDRDELRATLQAYFHDKSFWNKRYVIGTGKFIYVSATNEIREIVRQNGTEKALLTATFVPTGQEVITHGKFMWCRDVVV